VIPSDVGVPPAAGTRKIVGPSLKRIVVPSGDQEAVTSSAGELTSDAVLPPIVRT